MPGRILLPLLQPDFIHPPPSTRSSNRTPSARQRRCDTTHMPSARRRRRSLSTSASPGLASTSSTPLSSSAWPRTSSPRASMHSGPTSTGYLASVSSLPASPSPGSSWAICPTGIHLSMILLPRFDRFYLIWVSALILTPRGCAAGCRCSMMLEQRLVALTV
jgi:hypothetical protein